MHVAQFVCCFTCVRPSQRAGDVRELADWARGIIMSNQACLLLCAEAASCPRRSPILASILAFLTPAELQTLAEAASCRGSSLAPPPWPPERRKLRAAVAAALQKRRRKARRPRPKAISALADAIAAVSCE